MSHIQISSVKVLHAFLNLDILKFEHFSIEYCLLDSHSGDLNLDNEYEPRYCRPTLIHLSKFSSKEH